MCKSASTGLSKLLGSLSRDGLKGQLQSFRRSLTLCPPLDCFLECCSRPFNRCCIKSLITYRNIACNRPSFPLSLLLSRSNTHTCRGAQTPSWRRVLQIKVWINEQKKKHDLTISGQQARLDGSDLTMQIISRGHPPRNFLKKLGTVVFSKSYSSRSL